MSKISYITGFLCSVTLGCAGRDFSSAAENRPDAPETGGSTVMGVPIGGSDSSRGGAGSNSRAGTTNGGVDNSNVGGTGTVAVTGAPPGVGNIRGLEPACNYAVILGDGTPQHRGSCAGIGCHGGAEPSADLDLTWDSGISERLRNKPASFGDLNCAPNSDSFSECSSPPASCPSGALLVNSLDPDSSWMLFKLNGATAGCGTQIPGGAFASESKTCIEELIYAIADNY